MNDESNPQAPIASQKSTRPTTTQQPDQNEQQDNMQKQGNGKNAQGHDRSNQSGGRSGNDTTKSADSKNADAQRSGDDRNQGRSEGAGTQSHKGSTGLSPNRPGATDTSKPDADIDLAGDSDQPGGSKMNKTDPAKEPTAGASKTNKHAGNSGPTDSNRDQRGQSNPNQGGRKS